MRLLYLALTALATLGSLLFAEPEQPSSPSVIVASWNLENLFDADDDPDNPGDDAYTPSGWTRWTESRYRHKLTNLAEVVSEIRPDIIGLMEVENRRVVLDLTKLVKELYGWEMPFIEHRDSGDLRGIDTAIASRYKPTEMVWLKPLALQRDILVADFEIGGHPLTIIVNHWKSRYGKKAEADALRELEARTVRAELDRRLKQTPEAAIIVLGDFNDNVSNVIPLAHAGFSLDEHAVCEDGKLLFNLSATLPLNQRGTYFYNKEQLWHSFDMINISRGLLTNGKPAAPWQVRPETFKIYAPEKMRLKNGAPNPFRRVRTKKGWISYTGYSDHFPVCVTVEARP